MDTIKETNSSGPLRATPICVTTERVSLHHRGRKVVARKLTVQSQIPLPIKQVWAKVKTPALLQFIAAGMIRFIPLDGELPSVWKKGQTYRIKLRIFGFLPFGGTHYLQVERIDEDKYELATREWDQAAKVWNHTIKLREQSPGQVHYTDEIIIYGGPLTWPITAFAKYFYRYRQRRWQLVARAGLEPV